MDSYRSTALWVLFPVVGSAALLGKGYTVATQPSGVRSTGKGSLPDEEPSLSAWRCVVPLSVLHTASSVSSIGFSVVDRGFATLKSRHFAQWYAHKERHVARVFPRWGTPSSSYNYTFGNESEYYEHLQSSAFCLTSKKGGWTTMRTYEILANGCIPYFLNLSVMPPCIGPELPKTLISEGMALSKLDAATIVRVASASQPQETIPSHYPVLPPSVLESVDNSLSLDTDLAKVGYNLHAFAIDNLRIQHMGARFLGVVTGGQQGTLLVGSTQFPPMDSFRPIARILFLNMYERTPHACAPDGLKADYARDTLFLGLKQQGLLLVDVPRLDWLYEDYPNELTHMLYGRGFSYAKAAPLTSEYIHGFDIRALRGQWRELLSTHFFDHVVFPMNNMYFPYDWYPICADSDPATDGKSLLSALLEDMTEAGYNPKELSFVYGEDRPLRLSFFWRLPSTLQQAHMLLREGVLHDFEPDEEHLFHGPNATPFLNL